MEASSIILVSPTNRYTVTCTHNAYTQYIPRFALFPLVNHLLFNIIYKSDSLHFGLDLEREDDLLFPPSTFCTALGGWNLDVVEVFFNFEVTFAAMVSVIVAVLVAGVSGVESDRPGFRAGGAFRSAWKDENWVVGCIWA